MNLQRGILPAVLLGGIAAAALYANRWGRSSERNGASRSDTKANGGTGMNGLSHNGHDTMDGATHSRRLRHRRNASNRAGLVRVTANGRKYHREGCPLLHGSSRSISMAEALQSYEPCKACHPPVTI
jgi:hypothetical protein